MKTLLIILLALFSTNLVAQTNTIVDTDGDGLIEINDLEMLNTIRFQLDGTSYKATAETTTGTTRGCPNDRCVGYELTRNLDFYDEDSYSSTANRIIWTMGAGWQPIGDSSNLFTGRFEGNGFTISNLTINRGRTNGVGLFGYTGSGAEIANVGLLNADITGTSSSVGGLVGGNSGTITNSYAAGSISGDSSVGGLVGVNQSTVTNSYVTGHISGDKDVGSLAGGNSGTITNSYATGSVRGTFFSIGGLVGGNSGTITNSYATGFVRGSSFSSSDIGGLAGGNSGTITNSYWDVDTSGIQTSAGGTSKTTVALQSPTTATGIYSSWGSDNWDFGTSRQYPVLKYIDNPETDSSECRRAGTTTTTNLPFCGSLLSPTLRYGLSELQLVNGNLSPDFNVVVPSYRGTVVSSTGAIQFRPIAINSDAKVYITANEETRGMAIDSGGESGEISLNTSEINRITIEVENSGETTQTVIYTLYLDYYEFVGEVDRDNDGLIEIDDLEGLNAIRYQLDGAGYRENETAPKVAIGCPNNRCRGYELMRNLDFNDDIVYTANAGWQPIGDFSNAFTSQFEGNGFTVSNLMIDRGRANGIGLFGYTGSGSEIANVGLLNIDITGDNDVGSLVGSNNGTITNSYATGAVSGDNDIGGLVGSNNSTITNSYATGTVSGDNDIGGLVGSNNGTITNSYATGAVSGDDDIGGLVGSNNGTITNSYRDVDVSGIQTSAGGTSQTTVELQSPTAPGSASNEIYYNWSSDDWDFGTSIQYPILKHADSDVLLSGQGVGLRDLEILTSGAGLSPTFGGSTTRYVISFLATSTSEIDLRLKAYNADAVIEVVRRGEGRNYFENSGSDGRSEPTPIDGNTELVITVTEADAGTTIYTISTQELEISDIPAILGITLSKNGLDIDDTVNEGSRITLGADISSGDGNHRYEWTQIQGKPLTLFGSNTASPSFTIPTDYMASTISTSTDIVVQLTLEYGQLRSKKITIIKINNETPRLDTGFTVNGLMLGFDDTRITDLDGSGTASAYQWQRQDINMDNWVNIDSATTKDYTVPRYDPHGRRYRVRVTYTDAQGYGVTDNVGGFRKDVDMDNDGLIEINDLETLNAIRFQLDGTSYKATAGVTGITYGCPNDRCRGYELVRNLDFNDNDSYSSTANRVVWTTRAGWRPIGSPSPSSDPFTGQFEGNGFTISNLMINNSDYIGLFGYTESGAEVANVGLLNGDIRGRFNVGSLVGWNDGGITNSYATGSVTGRSGEVGGLVGWNDGGITNSYAMGSVIGSFSVGGLVGRNDGGITNSYATGFVRATFETVGGLVGRNDEGNITNSYATGSVTGRSSEGGGLVGLNDRGTITNSYWDINTSGQDTSDGGTDKTTMELQEPTMATGIYRSWGSDNWDFGTGIQYPILKYTDSNTLLPDQGIGLRDLEVLTSGAGLSPIFGASTTHYVISFLATRTNEISLQLKAYNADATIKVVRRGEARNYFENKGSDGQSEPIPTNRNTALVITVTEADARNTIYTISPQELEVPDITLAESSVMDTDDTVNEGGRITLGADINGGGGNYRYEWTQTQGKPLMLSGSSTASPSFTIPADYIESDTSPSTEVVVQLTLEYVRLNLVSVLSKTITIIKINNETPRLDSRLTVDGFTLSFDDTRITDSDGSGTASGYQWQKRDISTNNWVDIDSATTASYTVPRDDPIDRRYRVRVTYTDAQGYSVTKNLVAMRLDIDIDDDSLIEIYYLEQLDEIRYALDGSGYIADAMATTNTLGCPNDGCSGYELMRDLDFLNDNSYSSTANRIIWTMRAGWQPIGDSSNAFTGQFEGNGFTISNLMINRADTNDIGLFGYTESEAEIANVGLLNVGITGSFSAGGLVGRNGGIITNSYVTGSVSGTYYVGGLVGANGSGLVGDISSRSIANSYATGYVAGSFSVGGLVGDNSRGTITNSYATGFVEGGGSGGLVGDNSRGTITNSYATGYVIGSFSVGGLVGFNDRGIITNSYWDIDTSGIETSAGGTSKTTVALRSPTMATGIYGSWSNDDWNFGSSSQYPILKYTDNPNTDSSECRRVGTTTTNLPVCGSLLSPTLRYGLSELQLVQGNLSPDFYGGVPNYRGTVVSSTSTIQFRPIAINPSAKVYITANEEARGIAIDSGGESGKISLNTRRINKITIKVENSGETTQTVIYTLYLSYYEFIGDVDRDDDGLIEIDDLEGLNAIRYQLDGTGYIIAGCPASGCKGYELVRDLDFNDDNSYSSTTNRIIWATGAGWQPIGDFSNPFTGQFEGNGFTISNLMINRGRTNGVGLFGYTGSGSEIANVGLQNIDITGDNDVGGLVASNNGTITNSYAMGTVSGDDGVGSLVGSNNGTIKNSYAMEAVSGDDDVGGLVGSNNGTIKNSYAMEAVSGDDNVGGLVGSNNGTITNSYWDVDVSGIQISAGGTSKTTVELQSPTVPGSASNEIYYNWSSDDWDFGTSIQYPILKHADSDVLLSGQGVGLRDLEVLTSGAGLSPTFGASTTHYVISFVAETNDINLRLRAYNADAMVEVVRRGEGRNYFENSVSDGRSEPIPIDRNTELVITVTEADGGTTIYTISTQDIEMPDIAEISDITLSKNGVMDTNDKANEGSRITLGANISGGGGNYRYEWTQIQGEPLTLVGSNTASPSFTIPTDYIASTISTNTDIVVQLTLAYGRFNLVSMLSKTITAIKINNETPRLDSGFTVNGLTLSFDDTRVTDSDGNGTASAYQWQRQDINVDSWVDIDSTTTKYYTVPRYDPHGRRYRVRVTYTDAQGYGVTENVGGFRKDVDIDNDSLIEINDLETLNAIRFQLDGTSYKTTDGATRITYGCPNDRCRGYELARNLDFNDADSYSSTANRIVWTTGEGWQPIGTSFFDSFTGQFEGNGFTISNLMVNRGDTNGIGLFGHTASGSEIANVGLLNGDIRGDYNVGGLVGRSNGSITNSYATGTVIGSDDYVGGLVGWNNGGTITNSYATGAVTGGDSVVGGLVGGGSGSITNSYATGSVTGSSSVGGLVGDDSGTITNSYATGSVTGTFYVGGLVGDGNGSITSSYATGSATGGSTVGGLVGDGNGSITNSYATGSATGNGNWVGGLVGYNYGAITSSYATGSIRGYDDNVGGLVGWNDGGTITNSYATGSVTGSGSEVGGLVGDLFSGSITNSYATGSVIGGGEEVGGLVGSGSGSITNSYWDVDTSGIETGANGQGKTTEQLQEPTTATGIYRNWNTEVWDFGTTKQYPVLKYSDGTLIPNQPRERLDLSQRLSIEIAGVPASAVNEGERITLVALPSSTASNISLSYRWEQISGKALPMDSTTLNMITLEVPEDYVPADATTVNLTIILDVFSDVGNIARPVSITIVKRNNGRIAALGGPTSPDERDLIAPAIDLSGDPDGNVSNISYQWQSRESTRTAWVNVQTMSDTPETYPIPDETRDDTQYRVVVSYTDGQGYSEEVISQAIVYKRIYSPAEVANLTSCGTADIDQDDNGLIEICNLEGIDAIRYQIDGTGYKSGLVTKITAGCPATGCKGYELSRDLDFNDDDSYSSTANRIVWTTGKGWEPIGRYVGFNNANNNLFIAVLEGNDYTISNLMINRPETNQVGLFGYISDQSKILNTGLLNIEVHGNGNAGGLVGWNDEGTITNSYATGSVSGSGADVGGLVGRNSRGTITNSYATGSVTEGDRRVGGLVGGNFRGTITNSYATGSVSGDEYVGGLVGYTRGRRSSITNSYATGSATGSGNWVGGLVGYNDGAITNSYATGSVIGSGSEVGGLVGGADGWITDSYATGSVTGSGGDVGGLVGWGSGVTIMNSYAIGSVIGNGSDVGGLVGYGQLVDITNSYATGSVTGSSNNVGGLIGFINGSGSTIMNSYATGSVTGSGSEVGGLVGYNRNRRSSITNSYWDINTSGITGSDNGAGLTTEELQEPTAATGIYSSWGIDNWDFGTSVQYPILKYTDNNTLLPGQGVGLRDLEVLASGTKLSSIFGASTTHYVISFLATRASEIGLRLKAYNTSATIKVVRQGEGANYFENKGSNGRSEPIPIDKNTALVITVSEADTGTTVYTISPQEEANIAPKIMITPSLGKTLLINSTAHIVVLMADDNFNLDDIVTLAAMSSSRTIVSVTPAQVVGITTDTSRVFMLSAEQSGTATIMFTATDIEGLSDSAELSVRVNTAPILSGIPEQPIRLLEGLSTELDVAISDADADDNLSVRIDTSDSMIATATIIATNDATRTLEISGAGVGSAMITVMADDGRGVANSNVSAAFEVEVDANIAPTIMITPSTRQTLPLNSTAHIVVSVADDNFDLDDIVTLTAMSSSRTIVSVVPMRVSSITTDTSGVLMLNAERGGETTITFTATDIEGLSDSAELLVRVNAPPKFSGIPKQPIRLLEGLSAELDVAISDADADDNLSVRIDTSDNMIATATIIATNGTTRTLMVSGVGAGDAMITVTVDDGRGVANSEVSALFEVQVQANTTPTIMITLSTDQTLPLNSTARIVVSVVDDNFNLDDIVTLATMSSSQTIVSVVPAQVADITTDTSRAFMLSAEQSGTATITFTATDIEGLSDNTELSVRVNTAPTLSGIPEQPIRLLEGLSTEFDVAIRDADAEDNLSVRIDTSDSMIATATIIATNDATRTLEISGAGVGSAMITVTADDGRGVANSEISQQFEVRVDANIAPTIMITPSTSQTLPLNSTAHIVVSVVDDNFNLDDIVTLTAMSSSQTVISVTPAQVANITTDTSRVFMLSAEQSGTATIMFTATDRGRLRDSAELSVRVNTAPTLSGIPKQPIRLLEGLSTELDVAIRDADADDNLSVSIDTSDSMTATATIIATSGVTRTLEISGAGVGSAMITVTADDGRDVANSEISEQFEVQVEANTTPTIMITPSTSQTLPLNSTAHIVVSVVDDNFNLDDIVTLAAMPSSQTIVSVTPAQVANITTDTSRAFMLSAVQGGTATIMFTVTDIEGLSDSAELLVRVNTAPTLNGIPEQPIRLLEGLSTELDVAISDADADDNLSVRIDTSDSMTATATIIATNDATRMLEVSGVGAGNAVITVTVDDGRDVANSNVSAIFEVQVQANTTPTIMITPSEGQTLPLNSTAHIVVSVVDDNFNLDDIVTLTAMSSSQTVTSVTPAQVANITTDTSRAFMLNAEQSGTATIMFTATDIGGSSDSAELSVRVNTAPTLSGIPEQPIRLLEGLSTELDVAISDADAEDNLSVRIDTSDSMIATAAIIATDDTTRTLEVSGVGAGNAMVAVTVDDGRGVANSSVSAVFEVQVQANTTPTIMITPSTSQTLLLNSTASIIVSVVDDNFNLDDIVTLEAMSSSRTIVSVLPERVTGITTDTNTTFVLSAEQDGEAMITFTATDSEGLKSNSETVSVDVFTAIRIRVRVFLEGPLQ